MATTVATALVWWLRGDAAVMALVDGRIYQNLMMQGTRYPCLVLSTVSEPESYHQRGNSGLHTTRVQVEHYAQMASGLDAKQQVDDVAAAVDAALSGRRFTQADRFVESCFRANRIDNFEPPPINAFRVLLEFLIRSRILQPTSQGE